MVKNEEYEKVKSELETLKGIINSYIFESQQTKIKNLEEEIAKLKQEKEGKDKEIEELNNLLEKVTSVRSETLAEASERVRDNMKLAVEVGVEQGNKAIPIAGGTVGGLLGLFTGMTDLTTETALFTIDKMFGGNKEQAVQELVKQFREEKSDLDKKIKSLEEEKEKLQQSHVVDKKSLEEKNEELEKKLKKNKEKKKEFKKKVEKLEREVERLKAAAQQVAQIEMPSNQ